MATAELVRREARAVLRYSPVAPNKIRAVLGLIRGIHVDEARDRLRFCDRGAAEPVIKLLDSAVANAEHNDELPADELFVSHAFADEGPTQKRLRRRARGRGVQILKRTSHVTIVVARYTDDELEIQRRRDESSGGTAEARRRISRRRRVRASTEATDDQDQDDATADASTPEAVAAPEAAESEAEAEPETETEAETEAPEAAAAPGDDDETK